MTKIVALVEFCPPRLGSDRRIYELLTRSPRNCNVDFIVFPPSRALLGMLPFPVEHKKECKVSLSKSIVIHYIPVPRFLQTRWKSFLLGYFLTTLFIWPKVLQRIRESNPEIIMLNYPSAYTGLIGFVIGKLLNRRVVADFNDIIAEYTVGILDGSTQHTGKRVGRTFKQVIRSSLTLIQNYIVKHADVVIALTTYTIEYSRQLGIRNDIHLIPDGVNASLFNPKSFSEQDILELRRKYGIRRDEKVVLYVGRLEEWAGIRIVLKCAEVLKDSNVRFLLVGEGLLEMKDLKNIILSGRIPYEHIPKYLAAADVVLVPMEQNVLGHSASPLKLFEAMAMGRPIIASNTKGISDVVTDNLEGILLPLDEDLWTRAIVKILQNSDKASGLGRNARKRVEKDLDWNALANRLNRILLPSQQAIEESQG